LEPSCRGMLRPQARPRATHRPARGREVVLSAEEAKARTREHNEAAAREAEARRKRAADKKARLAVAKARAAAEAKARAAEPAKVGRPPAGVRARPGVFAGRYTQLLWRCVRCERLACRHLWATAWDALVWQSLGVPKPDTNSAHALQVHDLKQDGGGSSCTRECQLRAEHRALNPRQLRCSWQRC